jgi:predicted DNA-binding WGR domain protein
MAMIELSRIDPARNMRHFYRLDIQPDLFGGFFVMKQWRCIGTFGRITAERFNTSGLAHSALAKYALHKERRGYQYH